MFDRLELLIGKDNLEKIKSKKVLVVGIGGVGGSVVTSLVRSGIENIVIIDFDTVDITNLNRQVIAYQSTIGMKKTDAMEKLINEINPTCNIVKYDLFLDSENIKEIIERERPDYIVDACDSKETKKAIILEALNKKIKFITSMGTGNKLDPTKLEITDIRKTVNDPLARIFRKWVKDNRINDKILVLSSREVPIKTGNVVASNSFVPNSAGLLITSYIINDIINDIILNKMFMKGE